MLYVGCLGSVCRRLRLSLGLGVLGRLVFFGFFFPFGFCVFCVFRFLGVERK